MKKDDARKLDHTTLEALRIRAVRSVQEGERPETVARALRVTGRALYKWLADYRRGGGGALKAKLLAGRPQVGWQEAELAIQCRDAEESATAKISVCIMDAGNGG